MPASASVAVPVSRSVQAPSALRRTRRTSPGFTSTVRFGATPSMVRAKLAERVLLTASKARTVRGTLPVGVLGMSTGKAHRDVPVAGLGDPAPTATSTREM